MNKPVGADTLSNLSPAWLSAEEYLKLHLQITILATVQVERRDEAEDIASACLVDLWKASLLMDHSVSVGLFLEEQMVKRIAGSKRNSKRQTAAEQQYVADLRTDATWEWLVLYRLNRVLQKLPMLESLERQVLRFLVKDGLSLEQVACKLEFPVSKVRRLYKHAVFRLRKELGLLKRYW